MKKVLSLIGFLSVISFSAYAGNNNANPCGNNGNNCGSSSTATGGNPVANATGGNALATGGTGIGTGIGVGLGIGTGGAGGLGGAGGNGGSGGSVGNITATGGNITNEAADYGDLRVVPPAIAPSVNTAVVCPMVMQGSKAGSVFFFSASGTHEPDLIPICIAWHLGQKSVVEKMTCNASKEYRDANPSCSTSKDVVSLNGNYSVNTNPLAK